MNYENRTRKRVRLVSIIVIVIDFFNGNHGITTGECGMFFMWEIKSRIAMAKAAFNKKTLFSGKLDLNLRKKLVKCYIRSMALYGAETWTLRPADQKYLKCGAGEGWRRSVGPIM